MITLRLTFFITSILLSISIVESGYLKFCGRSDKYMLTSNSCSKGLWFQQAVIPNCVCAKGVWVLSSGLCDKQSSIIVANDHCFRVEFEVRAIKFIGNPNDPFATAIYAAPITLDSIFQIPPTGISPDLSTSDATMLVAINPRSPAVRGDNLVCVKPDPTQKSKPVHIYINPSRSPSTKWTLQSKSSCNDPKTYQYRLEYGDMYQDNKVISKAVIGRDCFDYCPTAEAVRNVQNATKRNNKMFDQPTTELDPVKAAEEVKAQVTINLDDYHKETNEQTIRMMHAHLAPTLLGFTSDPFKNYTREFEYFNMAKEIATVLCPEEYVPKNLLNGLMRMFKQLLFESIDQRPHEESPNDDQFKRIMDTLAMCNESLAHENDTAQQLGYSYINYTGFYNFTGSPGPSDPLWPKPEQCPEPLIYAIHGRRINKTAFNLRNATGNYNRWMKFNVQLVDFVIETAWKIVTIGHYHCSTLFNSTTAPDFSSFFHQMELLFNDKIIKRWYDTDNVKNTYRILKLLFPTYNLKKVAFGLDLCTMGAQQFSYGFASNAKWIQRPKIPFTNNDLSQQKYWIPGPGNGSYLSTNDYAPQILYNGTRTKREISGMFSGVVNCMDSFSDPVNRFGVKAKPGCSIPS